MLAEQNNLRRMALAPFVNRSLSASHPRQHNTDRKHNFKLSPDDVNVPVANLIFRHIGHVDWQFLTHAAPTFDSQLGGSITGLQTFLTGERNLTLVKLP